MNDCLILYILHHKAFTAVAESTEIPAPDTRVILEILLRAYGFRNNCNYQAYKANLEICKRKSLFK